ncbi:Cysteine-rich motor neuron 1 protein, partial [Clarias magur]
MRLTSSLNPETETGSLLWISGCWITRHFILSFDFQTSPHATGTATCRPRFEAHKPK